MSSPQSAEEIKNKECVERQDEMDAIAAFEARREFPPVSGAFAQPPQHGAGLEPQLAVQEVHDLGK
jgi:hypothetical protein